MNLRPISPVKELKRQARVNLIGNYRLLIASLIFVTLLPLSLELIFSYTLTGTGAIAAIIGIAVEILISIIAEVLRLGYTMMHMKVARGEIYRKQDVYYCFRNCPDHYIKGGLLRLLLTFLFSMPIYIGLYLFLYRYDALSSKELLTISLLAALGLFLRLIVTLYLGIYDFVLLDDEESTVLEVLKKSLNLMKGHFVKLLGIYISFIGYELLVFLSLTIGKLWVKPYLIQSKMVFYQEVIGESE